MPIAGFKPGSDPVSTPELPTIEPSNYSSIIYDDNNTPLTSLIAYVEGAPWTVKWLGQVVSKHNDLKDIDVGQSKQYQQYTCIDNLELRVDQDLQTSFDQASGMTTTTGSGNMYPYVTPNKGDLFAAESGDNRHSLFVITQVERRTYRRDSAWRIDYRLVGYLEDNEQASQMYNDAISKIVYQYYFDKDRLIEGLQPIIKSEEYHQITNLNQLWKDIVNYYFQSLYNINHSTIVVPGQERKIYDSKLTQYLMRLVSTDDAPNVRRVRVLPSGNDPYLDQPSLWSILVERDPGQLQMCNREFGLVAKYSFSCSTFLSSFRFYNIDFMVYPRTVDTSLRVMNDPSPKTVAFSDIIDTTSFKGSVFTDADNTYVDGQNTYKVIHEVLSDEAYVFTYAFYDNTAQQSLLEILTRDYIHDRTLDLKKLYVVANSFKKWKRLEQYYYGPIVLTLIKQAYRAQYT